MTKLHNRLMEKSAAYSRWHKHEYNSHYHWALLLFASGLLLYLSFTLAQLDAEPIFAQTSTELPPLPPPPLPPPPPPPGGDTTPPSTPQGLSAAAVSASQINLSWLASTDNVGVASYRLERCLGASCTNFSQVLALPSTSYADAGLATATTYRYRARAADAAGNLSNYSSIASAATQSSTTPPPPPPPPTPPSTKFSPGEQVQTTAILNVRVSPGTSSVLLGAQASGAIGTVVSGGQLADGYFWWNIDYQSAPDGWSAENFLTAYTATPPPPPPPPPPGGDTTAPAVSISNPISGATVSGPTATVSANASDPTVSGQATSGVAGVQFRLDGADLGAEDTSAPYSVTWDTTLSTNGSHTLRAIARDAAGNRTTSSGVAVTVSNITASAPVVFNLSAHVKRGEARFQWTTDRLATSQVEYGLTTAYGLKSPLSALLKTSHEVVIPNLIVGNYNARAVSVANNLSGFSGNITFTVRGKPPKINLVTASPGSIVLNWSPISFTGYSGVAILRSTTGYFSQYDANFEVARVTGTTYKDESVVAGTTYYYSLFVYDDQENYSDPAIVSLVAPASDTPTIPPPPSPPPPVSSGGGGGGGRGGGSGSTIATPSTSGLLPANFSSLPRAQQVAVLSAKIAELQARINNLILQGAQPSVSPTSCSFVRDLFFGSVGEDVRCLQKYLNSRGFAVSASGPGSLGNETAYFGPATRGAVTRWQQAQSIVPFAGYFGPKSRAQYSLLPK